MLQRIYEHCASSVAPDVPRSSMPLARAAFLPDDCVAKVTVRPWPPYSTASPRGLRLKTSIYTVAIHHVKGGSGCSNADVSCLREKLCLRV